MPLKIDGVLKTAWRTAAIYRCCRRYGKDRIWAMGRIREVAPDGTRDHLVDIWFNDTERLFQRHRQASAGAAAGADLRLAA